MLRRSTLDEQLGMNRRITRRDFLNGVAVGIGMLGSASLPGLASQHSRISPSSADSSDTYPPGLTGMRGSAPGCYDLAHALRDGEFWQNAVDRESLGIQ